MQIKKQQLEPDSEQLTDLNLGKEQDKSVYLWLFNFYADYIIGNGGLDDLQTGIKIPWRNVNNFRYADDTTLFAESKEELKSLLIKTKEESEKAGLHLNIQNN